MLRQRLITGTVLLASVAAIISLGGLPLRLLLLVVYAIAAYEFAMLRAATPAEGYRTAGLFTLIPLALWFAGLPGIACVLPAIALFIFITEILRTERGAHAGFPGDALAHFALGITYLGVLGTALCAAAVITPPRVLFWFLFIVIAADTGAYFGGRALGGGKLAPRISPKKTVSGVISGILSAVIISIAARHWLGLAEFGWRSAFAGAALGLVIAVLAVFGDLAESLLKRIYDVKDSGTILPGHGGVLDRIDGYLFAAPVLLLLQGIL